MNIPANLQRFADFMATHSSPEGCVAGRRYMVPCISHPRLTRKLFGWGNWIPLIGPLHEDQEHVGFKPWHIHVDTRFITFYSRGFYAESRALAQPVSFSDGGTWNGVHDDLYLDVANNAVIDLRRLQCRRPVPPVFPQARWAGELQKAHAGCRVVDGLCPHRGIPIACGRHLAPGVRQCPGHGLAWDDDGRQVRLVEPRLAEASGVTA
jgi:hypothetical protein